MIIILGASGVIGSQLHAMAREKGETVIGTYNTQPYPGLQKFDMLRDSLLETNPQLTPSDTVVLLSAYTNPNWIFENSARARALNVDATCSIIDEAASRDAQVVFLSTEIIFPDQENGHLEDSSPVPSTVYAQQKTDVESYIQGKVQRAIIARTGWNVSKKPQSNCPIVNTRNALLSGNAKMARDNWFTLTDLSDTCSALLDLIKNKRHGIFHLAANPPVSRIELAEKIIASSSFGEKMSYEEVNFEDLSYPERRPARAWLRNTKITLETGHQFSPPLGTIKRKVSIIEAQLSDPEGMPQ